MRCLRIRRWSAYRPLHCRSLQSLRVQLRAQKWTKKNVLCKVHWVHIYSFWTRSCFLRVCSPVSFKCRWCRWQLLSSKQKWHLKVGQLEEKEAKASVAFSSSSHCCSDYLTNEGTTWGRSFCAKRINKFPKARKRVEQRRKSKRMRFPVPQTFGNIFFS